MAGLKDYPQLPNERSIRVIKLYGAANADEAICFDLISVSMDESPLTSYEALSYTWGGQPLDQVVYANGEESFVTQNAKAAMKKLRPSKPGKFRNIWIDAICINQTDIDEKASQVQMMLEVYARAQRVNIWLGEGNKLSVFILKWLRLTGLPFSSIMIARQKFSTAYVRTTSYYRRLILRSLAYCCDFFMISAMLFIGLGPLLPFRVFPVFKDLKRKLQAGIADMASREYWERAWTVQEAAVNPSCFVLCGPSEPLRIEAFIIGHFVVGLFYIFYGIGNIYLPYRLHLHSDSVYASNSMELNERALDSMCAKKATVEVDRIFALRAMFPHSLGSLQIDYSQPARDVYTDASRLLLTTTQRVRFLRYACRGDRADGFPSWVPAWNDPPDIPEKLCSCAPAMISEKSMISEGGDKQVLRLKGLRIDRTTANVSKIFPKVPPPRVPWSRSVDLVVAGEAFAVFRAWVEETWDKNGVMPKLSQFASLLAGIFNLKASEVCEWFPSIWEENDFGTGQKWGYVLAPREVHNARKFTREFLQLVSGRSLFLTTGGKVGMSTLVAREGDEVALLTGEQLPYLIRKCPSQPGKYTLVAPCWISGAVNGEAWSSKSSDELLRDLEYIELL
ncbi:heterokaryon incompatibility protein-domain-containing protein [Camillea tinctor]|nr:heterokaryon incompatibility protein-domain-containing protein [Camillea tinctor]